MLTLGFSSKSAIPLGNIAVIGSALVSLVVNMNRCHPSDASRPLIDWDIISMMEPTTMLGALIGAYLHHALPVWLTNALLVGILSVITARLFYKGVIDFIAESKEAIDLDWDDERGFALDIATSECKDGIDKYSSSETINRQRIQSSKSMSRLDCDEWSPLTPAPVLSYSSITANESLQSSQVSSTTAPTVQVITISEHVHSPWSTIVILVYLFAGVSIINTINVLFSSKLTFLSMTTIHALFNIILIVYVIVIGQLLRRRVLEKYRADIAGARKFLPGDIEWNDRNSILYPLLCTVAGIIAGLFGVGGGIIKAPLLIEMGVNPFVVSATSLAMIVFTTSTGNPLCHISSLIILLS